MSCSAIDFIWRIPVAVALGGLVVLAGRIVFPSLVTYPWQHPARQRDRRKDKSKTVVIAGSFNPPHLGHSVMIQYLAERYGEVVVVIGFNPSKKYAVSPEKRKELLNRMLKLCPASKHVRVEVVEGYIWRYARSVGAEVFYRGIRSWEKDGEEERGLHILNTWGPLLLGGIWPIPTSFLEGHPDYNHVSSTLVRDLSSNGKAADLEGLVPISICEDVARLYGS